MSRITSFPDGLCGIGWLAGTALVLAVLGAGGCRKLEHDPSRFQLDPALEWGRQAAPARPAEFSGLSNEARQIERNVGVR